MIIGISISLNGTGPDSEGLTNLELSECAAPDEPDGICGEVEPHEGAGVAPRLRGDLAQQVLRQVQLDQVRQAPKNNMANSFVIFYSSNLRPH